MERLKCNFRGKPHLNAVKYYHIYEQLIEIHHLDVGAVLCKVLRFAGEDYAKDGVQENLEQDGKCTK